MPMLVRRKQWIEDYVEFDVVFSEGESLIEIDVSAITREILFSVIEQIKKQLKIEVGKEKSWQNE